MINIIFLYLSFRFELRSGIKTASSCDHPILNQEGKFKMSVCVEDNVLEELLTLLKLEKIENNISN